ncbi:MAG: hypothetical protein J6A21_02115 [Lentisphaeria bacterium]|nr:hypothetical protein [Lentisphaeria bacterium]
MNKKKSFASSLRKISCLLTAALLPGLFLASCATTDRTDDAVEKARAFALERAKDLSEYQRNVIRYTLPKVQEEELFVFAPIKLTEYDHIPRNENVKPHNTKHLDSMAFTFVWEIPSLGGEVAVYGTGDRAMRHWEPLRMVYRKLAKVDGPYEAARDTVVSFTADNMLYISEEERTRIRFSEAKVYCTSFDLAYLEAKRIRGTEGAWEAYRVEKEGGKKERFQLSLVWDCDDPSKVIVFTGMGAEIPDEKALEAAKENKEKGQEKEIMLLTGWKILCVHVLEKSKLSRYVVDLSGRAASSGKAEEKK